MSSTVGPKIISRTKYVAPCRGATIKHEGWFVNSTQTLLKHSRFSFYNRHNTAQAPKNKNSLYLLRRTWPIATWRNLQCNLTTEVREAGGTICTYKEIIQEISCGMTMKNQFIIRLTSSVVVFLVEIRMWTLIHKNIQLWNDFVLIVMLYELQALPQSH